MATPEIPKGDVGLLTSTCAALIKRLAGLAHMPLPRAPRFDRYVGATQGVPPNKRLAGAVIVACMMLPRAPRWQRAMDALEWITDDEDRHGIGHRELLCPDSHQGIYDSARLTLIAHGTADKAHPRLRAVALRQAALLASDIYLHRAVADPWGGCHYLPGMRADQGVTREARTALVREVMQQAPAVNNLPWSNTTDWRHRGYGGGHSTLERLCPIDHLEARAIWYGAAWAVRLMPRLAPLLTPNWPKLPRTMPLELNILRLDTGVTSWFTNPGTEEARRSFITRGSESARASADGVENPTTWVSGRWRSPRASDNFLGFGLSWQSEPPVPAAPDSGTRSRITIPGP